MFKNLLSKFIKVGAIALIGNTAAAIGFGVTHYVPTGLNAVTGEIYNVVVVSGLTGLVAVIERIINWNPSPTVNK
jgi:hypothetical protein